MKIGMSGMACAAAALMIALSPAGAAPLSPEDKYIATRDATIAKFSPLYDAGALDDAATKAEAAAFADLLAQMSAAAGGGDGQMMRTNKNVY